MERKLFLSEYLIWVILLLWQLHGYDSCIQKERKALLELKKYIISNSENAEFDFTFNTWTNDTKSNCCQWEGIMCDHISRRVIRLSTGGYYVAEDSSLNLSLLHPFEEVHSLDLSGHVGFSALFDDVEGYKSLKRLGKLEVLNLSTNIFNNSIFPFLNAATSIKTLILRDNEMYGPFPDKELKNLTNLDLLDLSGNNFNSSILIEESHPLKELKALDLSNNGFTDSVDLQGICKFRNLQELDISHNILAGQFPLCITGLTGLRVLDLSANQLTGKVPPALSNLESLEYLSLVDNNFEGFFSLGSLANLSNLKVVTLGSQSNSLQLDLESSWQPKFQLSVIALRSCNLEEVPSFLQHQKELRQVDLSNNRISGLFPSWLLENNTKLEVLLLPNNSFTSFQVPKVAHKLLFLEVSANEFSQLFPENIGWIFPYLRHMNLAENNFQGNLPSSLGNMKEMYFLDISHNNFSGKLPRSFEMGCYSMEILKLSYNKLSGEIFPRPANLTQLYVLFMDNNQFTGKIGEGFQHLFSLKVLDMSNNYLTGVIPSWIGDYLSLGALFISNNLLEGEIPASLFNMYFLKALDLTANKLSGSLPPRLNSMFGVILNLQDNNLTGPIPDTLLENVTLLDLRNNNISGNIPEFIHTQNISILLLKGNNLTGPIPQRFCEFSTISLMDLSNNRLNGSIPSCLSKTSFGKVNKSKDPESYEDLDPYYYDFGIGFSSMGLEMDGFTPKNSRRYYNALLELDPFSLEYHPTIQTNKKFATKHRYDSYMAGSLRYMVGLDLSENELSGEIPEDIGDLLELHALNLSRNDFSGSIPESFSRIKNMESLDLSFNSLQGRIPSQLTEMSSLAVFNVSYNNLSGAIPRGRQFNTFDESSYIGNPLLCGEPTNKSCNSKPSEEPEDGLDDDEASVFTVAFCNSFVVGFVTIVLGLVASLSFNSSWSRSWFYVVDVFIYRMKNLSP